MCSSGRQGLGDSEAQVGRRGAWRASTSSDHQSAQLQPVQSTGAQTAQSLQGKGLCLLSDLEATDYGWP